MRLPPHPFFIALQFLTTIPVTLTKHPHDKAMGRSALYYPLVGVIVGGLLGGFVFLVTQLTAPASAPLIATLTLVLWVLITGGLHLDGLADSVDALMGGLGDRQKTLDIMKDPTSGPMGVVALILVLLVKFTAIWQLVAIHNWQALFIAPLIARASLVALFASTPYVRRNGLGAMICKHLPKPMSMIVLGGTCAVIVAIAGSSGLYCLLTSAGLFFFLRMAIMSRLDGTTGDTAGALVELIETSVLVTMIFAIA